MSLFDEIATYIAYLVFNINTNYNNYTYLFSFANCLRLYAVYSRLFEKSLECIRRILHVNIIGYTITNHQRLQTTPTRITRKDRREKKYGKKIHPSQKISATGTAKRRMIYFGRQERTLLIWYLERIRKIILIRCIRRHLYRLLIRRYVRRVNYGCRYLVN